MLVSMVCLTLSNVFSVPHNLVIASFQISLQHMALSFQGNLNKSEKLFGFWLLCSSNLLVHLTVMIQVEKN